MYRIQDIQLLTSIVMLIVIMRYVDSQYVASLPSSILDRLSGGGFNYCANLQPCLQVVSKVCPSAPWEPREVCIVIMDSEHCQGLARDSSSSINRVCSMNPPSTGMSFRDVALGDEVCRAIPLTQIGMISFDIDDGAPPPTCYEINELAGSDPFLQPISCDSRRKRSVKQPSLTGVFSRAQVETTRMAYSDHIRGIGPGWNYAEVPGAPGGPNSFTAVGSAVTVICGSNLISNYQCGAAGLGESNNKWTRIAFTIPDCPITTTTSTTTTTTTTTTTAATTATTKTTTVSTKVPTRKPETTASTTSTTTTTTTTNAPTTQTTAKTTQVALPDISNLPFRSSGSGCVTTRGTCTGTCGTGTRVIEKSCGRRSATNVEPCQLPNPCTSPISSSTPAPPPDGTSRSPRYGPWSQWSVCTSTCRSGGQATPERLRVRVCNSPSGVLVCINAGLGEAEERGQCLQLPVCPVKQTTRSPTQTPTVGTSPPQRCSYTQKPCRRYGCCPRRPIRNLSNRRGSNAKRKGGARKCKNKRNCAQG